MTASLQMSATVSCDRRDFFRCGLDSLRRNDVGAFYVVTTLDVSVLEGMYHVTLFTHRICFRPIEKSVCFYHVLAREGPCFSVQAKLVLFW